MKILKKIKNGIVAFVIIAFTFFLLPFAKLYYSNKNVWLITERPAEARDNGFIFFKYMRTRHKEYNCFYAIKYNSPDYENVKKYGNVIKFGSLKHLFLFCGAKAKITSNYQFIFPSYYLTYVKKYKKLFGKYVFLQHGITYNKLTYLFKQNSFIDLFVCGSKLEHEYIMKEYGYNLGDSCCTGFARFDEYFNNIICSKNILVMPTWRRGFENSHFEETLYFKKWSEFLSSCRLSNILKDNQFNLYFYLHPAFQKYKNLFVSSTKNIIIASGAEYNVRDLLISSSLLVTDFSSVFFDFAYMEKPVIYYHFDFDYFKNNHYKEGYFDFYQNGFGPITHNCDELITKIEEAIKSECTLPVKYRERADSFFMVRDNNNCDRIFDSINRSIIKK